jgi:ribonuclease P protein subunit RPR2
VKPVLRQIALERMQILINNAISNAKMNSELSQRQALLAKRISTRHKIRMPYELKIVFCKKCKSFIAPGINSKIRLGRTSIKSIRISCNFCGHTYRKIISQ